MGQVAITGGIAEGKSTVLAMLGEAGYRVASADEIVRCLHHDAETRREIAQAAGLDPDAGRDQVRRAISEDAGARRAVNRLLHERVAEAIAIGGAEFVEVPLLLEACLQGRFDAVLVVTCGIDEQRARLLDRYGSEAEAERLLATQLPTRVKLPFADAVVRTNAPLRTVRRLLFLAVGQIRGE